MEVRSKKSPKIELFEKLSGFKSKEINKTFLIKVSGMRGEKKFHNLIGVAGLLNTVGFCIAAKMLKRAFRMDKKEGKEVCKLRGGLKVEFYYK